MGIGGRGTLRICAAVISIAASTFSSQAEELAAKSANISIEEIPTPIPRPVETASAETASEATAKIELSKAVEATARSELECLARGIYFEARGEPTSGQIAVGHVILNRAESDAYPDTVCDVVYQNDHLRNRCQFSFACDGQPDAIEERSKWAEIRKHAQRLLSGDRQNDGPGQLWASTHYHANYVSPDWARKLTRTGQVGRHYFYRDVNA